MKEPHEMTFLDHLEALRWHLVRSAAVILVIAIVAFMNKEIVFDGIIMAPKNTDFLTYRVLCDLSARYNLDMCLDKVDFSVVNLNISGQFTTHMWIAFMAGFVLGFPYLIWEIWRFVKPALSAKEIKYSKGIVFPLLPPVYAGYQLWLLYHHPLSINFLGNYKVSEEIANSISMDSYINTVTVLSMSTGIVFELPMVVYFLSKLGILTPTFMRQYRKHAMVLNLIIAALITPSPDITSQLMVAIPLFLLYEISIYVSKMVATERAKAIAV
ncbi:MAG: twin-arginine translocase subunit TatC [Bacteroidetes bacterium]|nr:twin-arginine translocase subunit TatC [Bacteroidota bacterium]